MTRVLPGISTNARAVLMVIDNTTAEYPTGPENEKSTTQSSSIFDDGSGTLIPGSYWGLMRVAVSTPVTGVTSGATNSLTILQHDGSTAYDGLVFTHTFLLAGVAGAGLAKPESWPVPGYIGRKGISVKTSSASHVGMVSFTAYTVR